MTVKIKQREIDKDALEQHPYIKYGVTCVSTYHDGVGNPYLRVINRKSQV